MKKCLGPCVNAVSNSEYGAAVDHGLRVLRGEDTGLLEQAAQRRDELGEELRFEEAAELRDRIRDLEQVIGVQQRLSAFSDRNVVLVTPDRQPDRVRLLLVRAGRLVDDVSLPVRATPSHLRHLLRRTYGGFSSSQVSRDQLDDLLILDAWLRRHHDGIREVPVPIDDPDSAVQALRAALVPGREAVEAKTA
jgi:excinuclease ABC subunit C